MGKLILTRSRQPIAILCLFQIVIDGRRLASINHGQTAVIELSAGHHEVMAWIDWCRSNPLGIEVDSQGTNYVEVGATMGWWYWLLIFTSWFASAYWHSPILGFVSFVLCLRHTIAFRYGHPLRQSHQTCVG